MYNLTTMYATEILTYEYVTKKVSCATAEPLTTRLIKNYHVYARSGRGAENYGVINN